MDSLTQLALGAAIGEAVMGRKIAAKAALYGAAIATLPDLDVIVPMGGPVADFTYHRSWSHSLIVLALVSPIIAFGIHRWRRDPPEWLKAWMLLVGLVLLTHPLLDAFTIYGTQLLWPLTEYPFGIGSIFIVDPLYTLPLLVGVVAALMTVRTSPRRRRRVLAGLVVSTAYLCWTLIGQGIENRIAARTLAEQGVAYDRLLTIPAPFTSLLWRTIAVGANGKQYHVGYHSLADGTDRARFKTYSAGHDLLKEIPDHWPADRLMWFSKGYYNARIQDGDVVVSDLRMGVEGRYVFSFKVGESAEGQIRRSRDVRVPPNRDLSGLSRVWDRIWDANVNIVRSAGD